ncbi:MAG: EsaB/YukD family protein [Bacillota bacterium]
MSRAMLTVTLKEKGLSFDLEVPTDLPAADLCSHIVQALLPEAEENGGTLQIKTLPFGRALLPHETLADAGVWDGGWLVIQPYSDGGQEKS